MKLNPPKLASKDGILIFVDIGNRCLEPASWSILRCDWIIASLEITNLPPSHFSDPHFRFQELRQGNVRLRGWLPIPPISSEKKISRGDGDG